MNYPTFYNPQSKFKWWFLLFLILFLILIWMVKTRAEEQRFWVNKDIPYRLQIGTEKPNLNWIDVCCIYNSNLKSYFEDKSPILKIYDFPEKQTLLIIKIKSKWLYWYGDTFGILRLIKPSLEETPLEKRKIYEYKKY